MKRPAAHALTSAEILELGDVLRQRSAEIGAARATHLLAARGPGESVDEQGERAEQEIEAETNDVRAETERHELVEVEHALAKIAAGTYGLSEISEEPIGVARLRAVPTARVTVQEQEEAEQAR